MRTSLALLADPLDPAVEAEKDPILERLMQWASTVVRVPLLPTASWVGKDIQDFASEFVLFAPHVARLELTHPEELFEKEILTVRRLDGAVVLIEADERSTYHVTKRIHRPSPAAQSDAGELARRDKIPVVWAVPEKEPRPARRLLGFLPHGLADHAVRDRQRPMEDERRPTRPARRRVQHRDPQ